MNPADRFTASPIRMIRFEGITVRSDALSTIALLADRALTVNDTARARGASAGSTSNTLRRLCAVGVLQAVELPPCPSKYAPNRKPLTGYRCTALGKRLLAAADRLMGELEEEDPEATWPKVNTAQMVNSAIRSQPRSVFDLGRVAANDAAWTLQRISA